MQSKNQTSFASQDRTQNSINLEYTEFYQLFSDINKNSPVQEASLKVLEKMAATQRASMPLFGGACAAYTSLIIAGIQAALDPVNQHNINSWQKKCIFFNLFKASQNECLHKATRDDLNKAIRKLNDQGAFIHFDLSGLDLAGITLSRINLTGANLSDTNLSGADLSFLLLPHANLSNANLSSANLDCANLSNANLSGANLSKAELTVTDLKGANLSDANLSNADLTGANLLNANLTRADIINTTVEENQLAKAFTNNVIKEEGKARIISTVN